MARNVIGTVAIINRGKYDENATYYRLNMVVYKGGIFIAKNDNIQGIEPTNEENWVSGTNGIEKITEEVENENHIYTIHFTDKSTFEFVIKDGKTPVKGVDYYTTEDIESLNIPTKTSDITNDSNFGVTNANNNFSSAQTINGTLTVNGDIVQNGKSYETVTEQLKTKKDFITLRDGAIGGLSQDDITGFKATKYDGTNNGFFGFRADGTAVIGDENDLEPIVTREEESEMANGKLTVWNSEKNCLVTDDNNEVIKSTYLTGTNAPIQSTVGFLGQTYIDSNANVYKCVKIEGGVYTWKLLTDKKVLSQAEYDNITTKDSNIFYYIEEA